MADVDRPFYPTGHPTRAVSQSQSQSPKPEPLERCERDGWKLVQQGLATIVRVAKQSKNHNAALAAGQWLVVYGERVQAEQKARHAAARLGGGKALDMGRAAIIEELRGLYAKALGEPQTLVVEAQAEDSDGQ